MQTPSTIKEFAIRIEEVDGEIFANLRDRNSMCEARIRSGKLSVNGIEKRIQINNFFQNCSLELLGETYPEYAFKFESIAMPDGSTKACLKQ